MPNFKSIGGGDWKPFVDLTWNDPYMIGELFPKYQSGAKRTSTRRVCAVAVSSPGRGSGQSIGDSTSRMQPEQCPCGDVHPPDRLRHAFRQGRGTRDYKFIL